MSVVKFIQKVFWLSSFDLSCLMKPKERCFQLIRWLCRRCFYCFKGRGFALCNESPRCVFLPLTERKLSTDIGNTDNGPTIHRCRRRVELEE